MENNQDRKHLGNSKDGVIFPMPSLSAEMDKSYIEFIDKLKSRIASERIKVTLSANSSMICLYWDIGKTILNKQKELG